MDFGNTEKITIQRFENGRLTPLEDVVLAEKSFALFLNGNYFERVTCTGKEIKELVAGRLFCGSMISSADELRLVSINDKAGSVYAETATNISTGGKKNSENREPVYIDYTAAIAALEEFQKMSPLFKETGSVHSAALLDKDYGIRYFAEDMSRHNAVDKVAGKALLDGFDTGKSILVTSSRMPFELIIKAYRAGIRAVISISAPTLESVNFARENHMILIGMFRNGRINIYSDGAED